MIKQLFLLMLLVALCGCSRILSVALGIHDPKIETPGSLNSFLIKNRIDTANVFVYEKDSLKTFHKETYKPGYEPGLRPIQMLCFNQQGNLIMQWSSCEGSLKMLGTLDTFPPKNGHPSFPNRTLKKQIYNYRTLTGEEVNINQFSDADYVFVLYWAVYTDRQARNMIQEVENYIQRNPTTKFKVLKVNIDKVRS